MTYTGIEKSLKSALKEAREEMLVDVSTLLYRRLSGYPEGCEVYNVLKDVLDEVGKLE